MKWSTVKRLGERGRELQALVAAIPVAGETSADLARRLAALDAGPADVFSSIDGADELVALVDLARRAGASLADLEVAVAGAAPQAGDRAEVVALSAYVETALLVAIARTARSVVLASWDEATEIRTRLVALFDAAQERAADRYDAKHARELSSLAALVTRALVERARPLARVTTYDVPSRLPVVVLAHRLYQDSSRTRELLTQNRVVHPGFMPARGRALSE